MQMVFDIGGTWFRYAKLVDGEMVARGKEPTPNHLQGLSTDEIQEQLLSLFVKAIGDDTGDITEIGICYAGPVSGDGRILGSPTIHGTKLERPYDLRGAVRDRTGITSVWVINDLSAAAFRYVDEYRSFELITVSTSVGNKIVVDGQLQLGGEGYEGELGHVPAYLPQPFGDELSIACPCGFGDNHIGVISSGRGIGEVAQRLKDGSLSESYATSLVRSSEDCSENCPVNRTDALTAENHSENCLGTLTSENRPPTLTTEIILKACEHGDAFSQRVVDICTYPLAYAICLTLTSMYLEKVILIGGVILNSSYYFDSLMGNILKIGVYNYTREHLTQKIVKGAADEDSGLLGMQRFLSEKHT